MKPNHFNHKGVTAFGIFIAIFILTIIALLISSFLVGLNLWDILQTIYLQVGVWFILIAIGVFLVISSITMMQVTHRPLLITLAKVGMAMICLSLLVVIVSVLLPLFANKLLTFEECRELVDIKNVYKTLACVFVGYSPTAEATMVTYLNFIIVAIIAPITFFYYIFADLIATMNFPSDRNAQKAIAFIGAYVALRGALASYFIEFFTYGWLGMGVLAFGVFMMMMAWALIKKYFDAVIMTANMRRLFEVISGGGIITPRDLILLIVQNRLPYTFLAKYLGDVESTLNKLGYQSLANQIRAKMLEADQKFGKNIQKKNQWLSNELPKLV